MFARIRLLLTDIFKASAHTNDVNDYRIPDFALHITRIFQDVPTTSEIAEDAPMTTRVDVQVKRTCRPVIV